MRKPVPWADLEGPIIDAKEVKKREPWVITCSWVMCAFLLVGGLFTHHYIASVFAVLYVLVLLMQKSTAVTSRGVEIFHEMFVTTNYEFWAWKDIAAIAKEENPKFPQYVALYFTRGDRTKRIFFDKKDTDSIIRLAKQGNPGLTIHKNEKK